MLDRVASSNGQFRTSMHGRSTCVYVIQSAHELHVCPATYRSSDDVASMHVRRCRTRVTAIVVSDG